MDAFSPYAKLAIDRKTLIGSYFSSQNTSQNEILQSNKSFKYKTKKAKKVSFGPIKEIVNSPAESIPGSIELIETTANEILATADGTLTMIDSHLQELSKEYSTLLSKLLKATGISPDHPSEHDTAHLTQENSRLLENLVSLQSSLCSLNQAIRAEAKTHRTEQEALSNKLLNLKQDCKQQLDSCKQTRNKLRTLIELHCDLVHMDITPTPEHNLFSTRISQGDFTFHLTQTNNHYSYSPGTVTIPVDNILTCTEKYSKIDLPLIFSRIIKIITDPKHN